MKLTDFDTLTFDCYGTLIDWERGIADELRPWTAKGGRRLADDELLETFAKLQYEHEAKTPEMLYPDVLAAVYRDLAAHWNIPWAEGDALSFGRSVGRWPAFADSAESLRYLKRFYKLVIISNVDRASFARSNEKLGVTFDKIITAEDVGSYKPSPRNFEYALRALGEMGIAKETVLHTAQSLFHDIVPAREFGLRTMWINRRKGKSGWGATPPVAVQAEPDFEVAGLSEFVTRHQAELGEEPTP